MLYFFSGTDTQRARAAIQTLVGKIGKHATVIRITDAHLKTDLEAALQGTGMFETARIVILDCVFSNDEMRDHVFPHLKHLSDRSDVTIIYDSVDLDAKSRKEIEKYAEKSERFDEKKVAKKETIFALANALQSGKKKELWVGYQRELLDGKAPEAIHGVLFWAAKQYLLRGSSERAQELVADLAEMPHEARRCGVELEYALERFILGGSQGASTRAR